MSKIPVTVITGFLGAGKTSLLNQLIKNHKDKKFVIIENEFGEENIDSELVTNIGNEDLFELSGGCICCNLNTELFLVLEKLISNNHSFNHLLIETTKENRRK
jgi:G3E family GTPase